MSVVCLPWLRWAQPNLPRPIRVNLAFPIVYILGTLFVTVVPMYASPVETGTNTFRYLSSNESNYSEKCFIPLFLTIDFRVRDSHDPVLRARVLWIHRLEEQAEILSKGSRSVFQRLIGHLSVSFI